MDAIINDLNTLNGSKMTLLYTFLVVSFIAICSYHLFQENTILRKDIKGFSIFVNLCLIIFYFSFRQDVNKLNALIIKGKLSEGTITGSFWEQKPKGGKDRKVNIKFRTQYDIIINEVVSENALIGEKYDVYYLPDDPKSCRVDFRKIIGIDSLLFNKK